MTSVDASRQGEGTADASSSSAPGVRPGDGPAARPAVRPPVRLDSLTGLRFVAAFLVFGFHVQGIHLADAGPTGAVVRFLFRQGSSGVTFFFILSGFVLAWSARPGERARRFWQRRFARIYPNHAVTLVCAAVLAVASGTAVTAAIVIPNVLLLQAWSTNPDVYFGLNTVSWSLSCEAFFYALFPLLYRGLMALPRRHLWTAAATALCLVWTVPLIVQLVNGGPSYWAVWLFPVARTPEFLAGMVLARIVREGRWPGRVLGVWPAAVLAVGVYLLSWWTPEPVKHVAVPAIPFALLIAAVGAADATGPGTVFRARWAVFLGEVSFAFYMVHQLVLRVVTHATGVDRPLGVELGIAAVTLGLAVLASWLLHRLVEAPAMRALSPRRTVARTTA